MSDNEANTILKLMISSILHRFQQSNTIGRQISKRD